MTQDTSWVLFLSPFSGVVLPWWTDPLSLSSYLQSQIGHEDKPGQPGVPWDINWAKCPSTAAPLHQKTIACQSGQTLPYSNSDLNLVSISSLPNVNV